MTQEAMDERSLFLSTMPAGHRARRLALIAVLASALVFLAAAPFAKVPLLKIWAFIPIYESVLIINDLITAVLLLSLFSILKSRALLVLASGYLFTAFITGAHGLSFPELFSPTGLLGAGLQTTAWLYMFWHGGFPLFVLVYALLKNQQSKNGPATRRPLIAICASAVVVLAIVCGLVLVATTGHDLLSPIIVNNRYTPQMIFIVSSVWGLSVLALIILWRRRPHSVLDLWLMVVMCAWIFDIALSAVLNAGRFDLGFYAGRIYGMLATSFVLMVLLLENSVLYAQLVQANDNERHKTTELTALNKELEAFAYSVSHDLRAPLRAINGYTGILQKDYAEKFDAEASKYLDRIRAGSERMSQLIDDLLTFSRLGRQPIRTQPIELDKLVNETIAELRNQHNGLSIDFTIDKLGTVAADSALLKQVWVNLLSNAVKFTRDKDNAVIQVGCRTEADRSKVYYVKDNGAGFDMRYAEKLFGVFQRLHSADEFEGTGVGLAIVQRIIHRHGGRIWADAKIGDGATFSFTLGPTGVPTSG